MTSRRSWPAGLLEHTAQPARGEEPDPPAGLAAGAELARLQGVLENLTERQRLVVWLRLGQEYPWSECADLLGCSKGSAWQLYRRAAARIERVVGRAPRDPLGRGDPPPLRPRP